MSEAERNPAPPSLAPSAPLCRLALGLALAVTALTTILAVADKRLIANAVQSVWGEPHLLLVFVFAYSSAFWLRAVAWQRLLGRSSGILPLYGILQTSLFANHLLPLKAGEVLRPYLASRRGIPLPEAATTTLLARVLDLLCLLALAAVLLPFTALSPLSSIRALAIPALLIALFFLGLLWFRQRRFPAPRRLSGLVQSLESALEQVSRKRLLAAALPTLLSWALEGTALAVAARAMGIDLTPQAAIAITAFTILFQTVHFTPGGIGVYEASMSSALILQGIPADEALTLAILTHGLKFAYSFSFGLAFALNEGISVMKAGTREATIGGTVKRASRFETVMARLWNVVNEGKPFTPVFVLSVICLLSLPHAGSPGYWARALVALLALAPLFAIFFRFDFPLRLRAALWVYLAAFLLLFGYFDPVALAVALLAYFGFTIGLWGTLYYHLRIGTPWTNFARFWRLVLENPDTTSGNFLEQGPKVLLLVLAFRYLTENSSAGSALAVEGLVLAIGLSAVMVHHWFFNWVPAVPLVPTLERNQGGALCRRFIAIVIDGCRADRLHEARTPFIDRLRAEGVEFTDMRTVYPARTVTCFSSMLTGAPPRVHGMRSNFVPRLGVKCDSLFTALRRQGLDGKLVGIAHLVDAFGEKDVRTVTAVMDNEKVDLALAARAKQTLLEENPELLVLQLISVDQTGHARGSYNKEYLQRIEATDAIIEEFLGWCKENGFLDKATVLVTADHGQGIGIGGHGHMSRTEIHVPAILWGEGVKGMERDTETHSIMDIAPTIAYFLGIFPPEQSVGQTLLVSEASSPQSQPVAVIIPAHNEAENLPEVLAAIPSATVPDLQVIVVDDGSSDDTGEIAQQRGARVVRHETNLGLGAALRTGLTAARDLNARAAVYLDADGEYDPREIPLLLEPIENGEADYVLGSRFHGSIRGMRPLRRLGNRVLSLVLSALCRRRISDGQTGFRAFSGRALAVAEIVHDYNYAQVLTLDLLRKGMRLAEAPITYRRRKRGRSFISGRYLWRVPLGIGRELLSE